MHTGCNTHTHIHTHTHTHQGYGLTECCATAAVATADDWAEFATNGPPMPCIEFRFESVPGALLQRSSVFVCACVCVCVCCGCVCECVGLCVF